MTTNTLTNQSHTEEQAHLDALTERLAARAEHDVDLAWATHDSPVGEVLLAYRGDALVRLAFAAEGFDAVLQRLGETFGRRTVRSQRAGDEARRELDDYFDGRRTRFDIPLDLALSTAPFRHRVHETLAEIPYGRTMTYREVADLAGNARAVRAVGTACATNPLPIVLPCHRVVRSDGSLGQYLGGVEAKKALLALEAR